MATAREWRTSSLILTLVVVGHLLCTGSVRADAVSEARTRYERALKFYDDGIYDAALVELARAYELNPSYRLQYNIAQTRVAMRDYAGAIDAFQLYLREGGGQVTNERAAAVRNQLSDLQQRVGKLTVETDVSDSEVLVDDVVVGTAPLAAPLVVNSGMRRLTIRHPDYPTHSQRVSVAGGEQLRVALLLRPRPADASASPSPAHNTVAAPEPTPPPAALTAAPPVASTRAEPSEAPSRTLAHVGMAVTGALAASAIVFGVVALNQSSALADKRNEPGHDTAVFNDERSRMKTFAGLADGFGIAAVAVAGVTTWLWLRDSGARDDQTAAHLQQPRKPRLGLVLSPVSARLRGEF